MKKVKKVLAGKKKREKIGGFLKKKGGLCFNFFFNNWLYSLFKNKINDCMVT